MKTKVEDRERNACRIRRELPFSVAKHRGCETHGSEMSLIPPVGQKFKPCILGQYLYTGTKPVNKDSKPTSESNKKYLINCYIIISFKCSLFFFSHFKVHK